MTVISAGIACHRLKVEGAEMDDCFLQKIVENRWIIV